jgi:hypothetical protein
MYQSVEQGKSLAICVRVRNHVMYIIQPLPYDPGASPARLVIAACPAAVAANLERFLSASAVDKIMSQSRNI